LLNKVAHKQPFSQNKQKKKKRERENEFSGAVSLVVIKGSELELLLAIVHSKLDCI